MFESVKTAQMYLRIKDGCCNGMVSISLIPLRKGLGCFFVVATRTDLSECTDFKFYLHILWKLHTMCGMLLFSGVSVCGEGSCEPGVP